MAGLLALGVAVCDDGDGTVTQPPPVVNVAPPNVEVNVPPTPPTVAPLTAMITPPMAEVGVDGMVDFAVGTSGGSGTASWTCSSSDVAVATVEQTDTGCRATAVAGGGATITAAVTKGSETTNVAAQLTVSTTTDAFILVTAIRSEGDGNDDVKGTVEVDVSVERGSQTFEKLSLNVDGMEVDAQDFGTAAADDAEQTVHEFTLSFNSAAYEEHGDHTDVAYMNGEHSLQALLTIAGRDEALMSNVLDVTFANDDGYMVNADLGESSMLDDEGRRWYGGPANGHIVISALGVNYSGAQTGAVTISLAGCEAEEYEGDDHGDGDDHGHGYGGAAFEFDCEGEDAGRAIMVMEGGDDANVLNEDDLPEANIDMMGPAMAPYFSPNPNNRQNGWVNQTVGFNTEQSSSNPNGWLTFNDEGADDAGVGGYMAVIRYAEGDDIEDAIGAAPLSLTNLPGESEMDAYCGVVSAVDALGNESDLPDEDDGMCYPAGVAAVIADDGTVTTPATADSYSALLEALRAANALPADVAPATTKADAIAAAEEALADAGILAGVDLTPPGIEIDEDMRINAVADLSFDFDIYDDENDEANSGLHSLAPLLVRIQRRTTDDTECLDIGNAADVAAGTGVLGEVENGDDESCTADPTALPDGTAITFQTTPATSHAYYTLSGSAVDQAGNFATPVSHTFVFDATVATATAPAAPGSLEAGESFEIASFLNDDLSIRDYYVTANFPDVGSITPIRLGIVAPTPVDMFNAAMLTHRNFSVTTDVDTYAGLQENQAATDVLELASVGVAVRDQADSDGTNDATNSAALTVEDADDPFEGTGADAFTVAFTSDPAGDDTGLCVAEDEDDCADVNEATETELEVVVTAGATGAFSDPFERVDFWVRDVNGASWMLGSDMTGESGRVSGTDRTRTWTYSLDATAMDLYMRTREAAFPPTTDSDTHTVLAFAVNDDGIAIVSEVTVTLDDGESDQ